MRKYWSLPSGWRTGQLDPERPFLVGPTNGRYAAEFGRRQKATVVPTADFASRVSLLHRSCRTDLRRERQKAAPETALVGFWRWQCSDGFPSREPTCQAKTHEAEYHHCPCGEFRDYSFGVTVGLENKAALLTSSVPSGSTVIWSIVIVEKPVLRLPPNSRVCWPGASPSTISQ